MNDDSLSYVDKITQACAQTLWAMAWADAMDEAGQSVRGDIFEAMPPVPALALVEAGRIVARAEADNRLNIHACLAQAAEDDQDDHRFGMCLAYSYVGAGVSWEDDHAPLMLTCAIYGESRRFRWPHGETPMRLRMYADALVSR
jgi:hypothetical protein